MQSTFNTSYILSNLILLLAIVASAGGLLFPDLYRDIAPYKTVWIGNDLVTLTIVTPLFMIALILVKRGVIGVQLIWMGMLGYMFYNYAFYLFGTAFNKYFLLYVALFSLSIYALITGLTSLDAKQISSKFSTHTPVKWISIFLLFISLPLGIVEASFCIDFILNDTLPQAPSLIFALDLSIVVPNTALAAYLLWKHNPWGYILGSIMLVKAFTYGTVLSLATAMVADFSLRGNWDPLMPFYVFVALGGLLCTVLLLKNVNTQTSTL